MQFEQRNAMLFFTKTNLFIFIITMYFMWTKFIPLCKTASLLLVQLEFRNKTWSSILVFKSKWLDLVVLAKFPLMGNVRLFWNCLVQNSSNCFKLLGLVIYYHLLFTSAIISRTETPEWVEYVIIGTWPGPSGATFI